MHSMLAQRKSRCTVPIWKAVKKEVESAVEESKVRGKHDYQGLFWGSSGADRP
jgi:hypothetical protein